MTAACAISQAVRPLRGIALARAPAENKHTAPQATSAN
jgi:hypothetical protein